MAQKYLSMKNLKFTLNEAVKTDFLASLGFDYSAKSIDMILQAAFDLSKNELHPLFEEMDRKAPELVDGGVKVHPGVKKILEILGKDGWISSYFSKEWGGENMPCVLLHSIAFIFGCANYSASVYSGLTAGAAKLIDSFGSQELKQKFIPNMIQGKWQGTMALTEPEAGTSLGDLETKAVYVKDGVYKITGEKIFISAGDHDCAENIIHLMLARIEGAPKGVKGISLFVVPKLRETLEGNFESNDVSVTQVFHKLGYRGAPITGLSMGDKDNCLGWLVGEENKGLSYMFQMMNGARLEVGMGAASIATAAYYSALEYTKARKQGRSFADPKAQDQVPVIEHLDIKRMLLFQRAVSEGALSLILQCGKYEDLASSGNEEDKDYHLLLELLTPVAKTYSAEMGILSTSLSIQCFGGYGYCEDFPVEQHFRDMRIHTIHEGTTGIQGLDLLGRKVTMKKGKALDLFKKEILKTIESADQNGLNEYSKKLLEALQLVGDTTLKLGEKAMTKGVDAYLENSSLYLEMFGHLTIGWQWLLMGSACMEKLNSGNIKKQDKVFYEGKLSVLKYYFSHELPKINYLASVLISDEYAVINTKTEFFTA